MNYVNFGSIYDDDHSSILSAYFAPNGDYYFTIQSVDDNGIKSIPIPFRLSLSGSALNIEWKHKMIELLKDLKKNNIALVRE